jgi:hypothetical protein
VPGKLLRTSLAAMFDRLYADERRIWLDQFVVNVSIVGFLVHLALIFLSRVWTNPPALLGMLGKNYLAAIYTPFSFILFYEVLMLIAASPRRNPSPNNTRSFRSSSSGGFLKISPNWTTSASWFNSHPTFAPSLLTSAPGWSCSCW